MTPYAIAAQVTMAELEALAEEMQAQIDALMEKETEE